MLSLTQAGRPVPFDYLYQQENRANENWAKWPRNHSHGTLSLSTRPAAKILGFLRPPDPSREVEIFITLRSLDDGPLAVNFRAWGMTVLHGREIEDHHVRARCCHAR